MSQGGWPLLATFLDRVISGTPPFFKKCDFRAVWAALRAQFAMIPFGVCAKNTHSNVGGHENSVSRILISAAPARLSKISKTRKIREKKRGGANCNARGFFFFFSQQGTVHTSRVTAAFFFFFFSVRSVCSNDAVSVPFGGCSCQGLIV